MNLTTRLLGLTSRLVQARCLQSLKSNLPEILVDVSHELKHLQHLEHEHTEQPGSKDPRIPGGAPTAPVTVYLLQNPDSFNPHIKFFSTHCSKLQNLVGHHIW